MNKAAPLAVMLITIAATAYLLRPLLGFEEPAATATKKLAFSLPDLDGVVRNLSDWDGSTRLVNFWATWCGPCLREIPLLNSVHRQQGTDGLQIIGVAVDFEEQVTAFAETTRFDYPVLIGEEPAVAALKAAGIDFVGLPLTLVLSKDGDLLKTHVGELKAEHIEHIILVLDQLQSGGLDLAATRDALDDF